MNFDNLKRDKAKVAAALKQIGNKVIALKPVSLVIPERFIEKNLASIGNRTYTTGIYALIQDDYYCVSRTLHRIEITPTSMNTIKYKGEGHVMFEFEKGATVFPLLESIKEQSLLYEVFNEIILKGRCPWYLSYDDLARLFENANYFAGVSLDSRHSILGMIAASITRSEKDKTLYYRHVVNTGKEPRTTISLRNVGYGTTDTTSALIGAYWNDGLTSALVNPSERTEKIEELLTK